MLVSSFLRELPQHADTLSNERSSFFDLTASFQSLAATEPTTSWAFLSETTNGLLLSLAPEGSGDFSPVLNVPALISFVVIALVFVSLQVRVTSIGEAADRRTEALKELRQIKAQQLEGKATIDQVNEALQTYEQSFTQVESLRNVLPGVRIRPPPVSAGLAQTRMKENEAAAQQFLGIEPTVDVNDDAVNEGKGGLSLPLVVILTLVLISQLSLLMLLASDPMSSPMDTGMRTSDILDAISGLE